VTTFKVGDSIFLAFVIGKAVMSCGAQVIEAQEFKETGKDADNPIRRGNSLQQVCVG
jgi:hypothetical protein